MDPNEVHREAPREYCDQEQGHEGYVTSAPLHEQVADEYDYGHVDPVAGCSVHLQAGMASREKSSAAAQQLAVSGSIAVRNSSEVNIGVDVRSDQLEEVVAAAAQAVAAASVPAHEALSLALSSGCAYPDSVEQKVGYHEEAVEQRPSHHASEMPLG